MQNLRSVARSPRYNEILGSDQDRSPRIVARSGGTTSIIPKKRDEHNTKSLLLWMTLSLWPHHLVLDLQHVFV